MQYNNAARQIVAHLTEYPEDRRDWAAELRWLASRGCSVAAGYLASQP